VAAFARALDEIEGPVLAFCRTGTRSATLWALAEAQRREPQAILATTAAAGYDLQALEPRLAARRQAAESEAKG
jgi:sulfide:quinone oxidoreductase